LKGIENQGTFLISGAGTMTAATTHIYSLKKRAGEAASGFLLTA
jgi:hypothetical protein